MTARSASSASPRTLLQVSDLSKSFGGYSPSKAWLRRLIRPHQGDHRTERRGKSTLLNLIGGSLRPDRGAVVMGRHPTDRLPAHDVADTAWLGPSNWFASSATTGQPCSTTSCSVRICVSRPRSSRHSQGATEGRKSGFRAEAREWLDFFGLGQMEAQQPRSLAFGQQRYVELARAMMLEPKLLLRTSPRRD